MDSTWLIPLFRKFQEQIGVVLIPKRQFYGLRRVMADYAAGVETDTRALRHITGWRDDKTRRDYLEEYDPEVAQKAAEARVRIREKITGEEAPVHRLPVDLEGLSEDELHALQERLQERLRPAAA